jgi:hypothetical protein
VKLYRDRAGKQTTQFGEAATQTFDGDNQLDRGLEKFEPQLTLSSQRFRVSFFSAISASSAVQNFSD